MENHKSMELVFKVRSAFYNWGRANDTFSAPNYFLYNDSFMLQALHVLQSKSTNGKEDTSFYRLAHYRFEDLRNKVAYFYTDFTPEAKLWGKLPTNLGLDTLDEVRSGFFLQGRLDKKYRQELFYAPAPDTIVDNIKYQRFYTRNKSILGNNLSYDKFWAVKNDTLLPFSYLPKLSAKTGLAYICSENYVDSTYTNSYGMLGIKLERKIFSEEERLVFEEWRKNCEKHKSRKMGIEKGAVSSPFLVLIKDRHLH